MHSNHPSRSNRQHGAILIITLVILAAMTLASVGLLRSVDTATLLSANIGFKRDATARASVVAQTLVSALRDATFLDNTDFGCTQTGCTPSTNKFNYTPIMLETGADGIPAILLPANTSTYTANFGTNKWTTNTAAINEMTSNRVFIYFLLERLCDEMGEATMERCVYDEPQDTIDRLSGDYRGGGGGASGGGDGDTGGPPGTNARPLYRLTVRADGPRQTTAYIQMIATLK